MKLKSRHTSFIKMHWVIAIDGIIWVTLMISSIFTLYNKTKSSWLYMTAWFVLHPIIIILYSMSKFSMYYVRHVSSMNIWIIITSSMWFFQSIILIHHIINKGFLNFLDVVDSSLGFIASVIALYSWFGAFWSEFVRPFSLIRYDDIPTD